MHDEDIFLRSNKGFAYLCIAPCILFSAAVWFTPNSAGIVIAHTFQIYFSILLFYLSLRVWSLRDNFDGRYSKELKMIAIAPALLAFLGVLLTLYLNPAWGIGFLTIGFYLFRFVRICTHLVGLGRICYVARICQDLQGFVNLQIRA